MATPMLFLACALCGDVCYLAHAVNVARHDFLADLCSAFLNLLIEATRKGEVNEVKRNEQYFLCRALNEGFVASV